MDTRRMSMAPCSVWNTPHQFLNPLYERRPRILLAATGCLAAQQFFNLCLSFYFWADIRCVGTKTSLKFINRASLPKDVTIYTDEDEWSFRSSKGGVLHIDLCKSADIMIIAPLSANSLTKIGRGLCDNLVTNIVRAWDFNKPILVAPTMTKSMWTNPFTEQYLKVLQKMSVYILYPVEDKDEAALPPLDAITMIAKHFLQFNDAL